MKAFNFLTWIIVLFKITKCDNTECNSCPALMEFSCGNCQCIPIEAVCDGQRDCDTGRDELKCGIPQQQVSHCPQDYFTCWNQQCLRLDWVCDGDNDCGDDSDELMCPPKNCTTDEFQCNNGNCVLSKWRCDGDDDCRDGSDEHCEWVGGPERKRGCQGRWRRSCTWAHECNPDQFKCAGDGACIDKSWVCDQEFDCTDGSDEQSCGRDQLYCGPHEFMCLHAQKCIPVQLRCNKENDCNNWEDEVNCTGIQDNSHCRKGEFHCRSGQCINENWRCDGQKDCADHSDEMNCSYSQCQAGQFRCQTGLCVDSKLRCNGLPDCPDNSDEMGCIQDNTHCRKGEFYCDSGLCINEKWRCDGQRDCADSSDEMNCSYSQCQSDQFKCKMGPCIDSNLRCNGLPECPDNSDEKDCDKQSCAAGQFHCTSGRCIGIEKVCNSRDDCHDGSDERDCHWAASCRNKNGGCAHFCQQTTLGARCTCRRGYVLDTNGRSCLDVNECNFDNACSQLCINTLGSYRCECAVGYVLRPDGHGCKAQVKPGEKKAYLIFANRVDIRRVLPDMTEYDSILQGLENAIALDFHYGKGYVYWSDVTLDKIKRAFLNGSQIKEVVSYGLESPGGVAVDWIHNNLFWTDSGTSRIEVSDLDGRHRKVLIWENLEKPRAIVVHPGEGTIYWTDWGSTPKIERSYMDGHDRVIIANTSLFWPNGLTVDYAAEKLYWADAKHHVIECSDLDGSHRRTVINQGLPHPFALTLFEDELYWTDWHTKSINKANKFTGNDVEMVRNRLHFPMDIHIFHQQRQPMTVNHCGSNKGDCSHLCLPGKNHFTCACPTGLHLKPNQKDCVGNIESFLLFTSRSDVRRITLGTPDQSDVVIPLSNTISTMAVEFDADTDTIYWSDSGTNTISRAKWDGSREQVVVGYSLDSPAGLAVDWVSKKLYWTDSEVGRIEVANLDGTQRSVLLWEDLGQPRDIIVDPISGYMFWANWKPHRIERAGMDGLNKAVLIGQNLTHPNGLTIDYSGIPRLYWIDTGSLNVESCTLEGKDRKQMFNIGSQHPFGLTLYDDKIYWTDWLQAKIFVADKRNGMNEETLQSNIGSVMDIAVFHRNRPNISSECQVNNGQCSHLCLLAPLPRGHTCACPTGVLLQKDKKTCNDGMRKFLIFAQRTDIRKISLDVDYFTDVSLPIRSLRNAIALGVDPVKGKVYWTDTIMDKIMRANVDGTDVEDIIANGLDTPDGMVVDAIGRKMYWTDTGLNRIEMSNLDGSMRKVLVWQKLDKPRAITLHYKERYLFWSDWGKSPKIERAELDGSNRVAIVTENLVWPNGLTVDEDTNRIIWADASTELIEAVDLDGNNRQTLVTDVTHPYSLTILDDFVYWTDWQKRSIFRALKDGSGGDNQEVVLNKLSGLMGIHAVNLNDKVDTTMNVCRMNNGGCSHLCLPNRRGVSCGCPSGLQLRSDNVTCETMPEEYLLFASRGSIRRIALDMPDHTDVYLPLPDLHNVIALDYDYYERKLYYSDVQLDVIRRANLNGTDVETVVSENLQTTDGLAVDWMGRNLYWTDTGRDVIEVSWLDGQYRKTLIKENLDQPRAIAVHPKKGLMYWTDWGAHPKIEKAYMDGSNRKTIISSHLGFPNGLSIDYVANRLYWVDAKLDKVETSTLNGNNKVTLIQNVPHPFGLTVFGEFIYWTDWQTQRIERADKHFGHNVQVIKQFFEGLMDIEVVSPYKQTGTNKCSEKNGGCTHLCLATPSGKTCQCPDIDDTTRPCLYVPVDVSLTPTRDNTAGATDQDIDSCSEEGEALGLCTRKKQTVVTVSSNTAYIALGVVIVIVLIGVLLIIFLWKRQRRRSQYMEDFSSYHFTNPNYQRTSTETINSERPPREWRIFRFNKRNERVSVVSSNCPSVEKLDLSETDALYPTDSDTNGASCFPERQRGKNIFKPRNHDTKPKPKVPYKHVEKTVT